MVIAGPRNASRSNRLRSRFSIWGDAGRDKLQVVQEGERERQHKRDAADRESTIHIPIYGLGPQDGWNGGRYRGTARWIRALATR